MSENMLEKVKKALLIPVTENYADDELLIHIASCRQLLITTGIPKGTAEDQFWLQERWQCKGTS